MASFATLIIWALILITLVCCMLINFMAGGKIDCVMDNDKVSTARTMILWYCIILTVVFTIMFVLLMIIFVGGKHKGVPSWLQTLSRTSISISTSVILIAVVVGWWSYVSINKSGYQFDTPTYEPDQETVDNIKYVRKLTLSTGLVTLFAIIVAVGVLVTFGYSGECTFSASRVFDNLTSGSKPLDYTLLPETDIRNTSIVSNNKSPMANSFMASTRSPVNSNTMDNIPPLVTMNNSPPSPIVNSFMNAQRSPLDSNFMRNLAPEVTAASTTATNKSSFNNKTNATFDSNTPIQNFCHTTCSKDNFASIINDLCNKGKKSCASAQTILNKCNTQCGDIRR